MILGCHVGCSAISGTSMRLDVGPALMVSCRFSKLIKKHLVVCHKSGVFGDGAICLLDGMGALSILCSKGLSQSFFPPLSVVSFMMMYSNKVFGQSLPLMMGALGSSQLPSESHKYLMVWMACTVRSVGWQTQDIFSEYHK